MGLLEVRDTDPQHVFGPAAPWVTLNPVGFSMGYKLVPGSAGPADLELSDLKKKCNLLGL